jgi:hypothetical protein
VVLADHHVHQRIHAVGERRRGLRHPHDLHRPPIQLHHAADHLRVSAEAVHPVVVREHHDRRHAGAVIRVVQRAPEHGRQPHDLEVVARHEPDVQAHGVTLAEQRVRHLGILRDPLERACTGTEIVHLRHGEEDVLSPGAAHGLAQVHQPLTFAVRKGLQEHATNDAEDRGVGADAESKGQDHGDGEPASAGERTERVAQVGEEHGQ